jgi:hypothetical protein
LVAEAIALLGFVSTKIADFQADPSGENSLAMVILPADAVNFFFLASGVESSPVVTPSNNPHRALQKP